MYTFDEDGYNPNGTEGNGIFNIGEDFPIEYDCGEDGICDDEDASDDYNIDPNNDNWLDCGADSDCEIEDEDDTQDNGEWDEGELYQGNDQFDSNDSASEFYYDWGIDQLPDSLEALSSDNLLTYSAPSTISYTIGEEMTNIDNNVDTTKDIIFDITDDGNPNAQTTSGFTVIINHPPEISGLTDIHLIEDNTLNTQVSFYDFDGDSLYYTIEAPYSQSELMTGVIVVVS